jgi:hypothetical protein
MLTGNGFPGPLSGPQACQIARLGAKYMSPEVPTGVLVDSQERWQ